jgi:uncharacterized protein (TIGR03435 family)
LADAPDVGGRNHAGIGATGALLAQAPARTFDAVSVKRSAPRGLQSPMSAGTASPGRWTAQTALLWLIVARAYDLPRERIAGGPSWINSERFDIQGVTAATTSPAEMAVMVRNLLADRFQLRTHTEQRPLDTWAVIRAREDGRLGPGLRANAACSAAADRLTPPCGGVSFKDVNGVTQLRTIGRPIADALVFAGARAELGAGVVDRTGLTGTFDIDIDYVPQAGLAVAATATIGQSLATAVQEQLGLKFERRREMTEVLVIDRVELPAEN